MTKTLEVVIFQANKYKLLCLAILGYHARDGRYLRAMHLIQKHIEVEPSARDSRFIGDRC